MVSGQIVLVIYALLMILGGIMGARAGSNVSLYAGGGSGVLLLVAYLISRYQFNVGLWIGSGLALLLAINFARRWMVTGKPMPSAALMALSVIALALMVRSVLTHKG